MKWTTEKPTQPGWYWVFGPEEDEPGIAMLEIGGTWWWPGWPEPVNNNYDWWMGPIEIPENPE